MYKIKKGSHQRGLNPRPSAYKADALPLSYNGFVFVYSKKSHNLLLLITKNQQFSLNVL